MKYCNNCRVHVRGTNETCVLCDNPLSCGEGDDGREDPFPEIPPEYERHLAMRIMILVSVSAVVISFTVRILIPTPVNWPLFVLFGLLCTWASLIVIIRKRHNIPKTIIWQVSIVSISSVLWDSQTGWHGWSVDYVIPTAFAAAILVMYIAGKITRLKINDYIFYALISGFFGIAPALFILFNVAQVRYPSLICVASSIIFLSALFLFHGSNIKKELKKRMHI